MNLHPEAITILRAGRPISAELTPSGDHVRRWVAVYPYLSGGPGGAPYSGVGVPTLDIHIFEAPCTSIAAGYDIAGELVNEVTITIKPRQSVDETLEELNAQLLALDIDPSTLGKPDDEFPL